MYSHHHHPFQVLSPDFVITSAIVMIIIVMDCVKTCQFFSAQDSHQQDQTNCGQKLHSYHIYVLTARTSSSSDMNEKVSYRKREKNSRNFVNFRHTVCSPFTSNRLLPLTPILLIRDEAAKKLWKTWQFLFCLRLLTFHWLWWRVKNLHRTPPAVLPMVLCGKEITWIISAIVYNPYFLSTRLNGSHYRQGSSSLEGFYDLLLLTILQTNFPSFHPTHPPQIVLLHCQPERYKLCGH